jgi:hypothetical protein
LRRHYAHQIGWVRGFELDLRAHYHVGCRDWAPARRNDQCAFACVVSERSLHPGPADVGDEVL